MGDVPLGGKVNKWNPTGDLTRSQKLKKMKEIEKENKGTPAKKGIAKNKASPNIPNRLPFGDLRKPKVKVTPHKSISDVSMKATSQDWYNTYKDGLDNKDATK